MTKFSYKKFFKSFYYAFRGMVTLIETEQNARIHAMLMIFAGICAVAFQVENTEAALLFFAFVLVFAIEIINTAVEKLLDLVHPESHSQIAFIKDALAGAVLIAAIIAGMVFVLVFYPYVKELL